MQTSLLAALELSLGYRPSANIRSRPKWATRVNQEHFDAHRSLAE
jgi:hypothetical protein